MGMLVLLFSSWYQVIINTFWHMASKRVHCGATEMCPFRQNQTEANIYWLSLSSVVLNFSSQINLMWFAIGICNVKKKANILIVSIEANCSESSLSIADIKTSIISLKALIYLQSELTAGLWWPTCLKEVPPCSGLTELWKLDSAKHSFISDWLS